MKYNTESKIEAFFIKKDSLYRDDTRFRKIPMLTMENYLSLGQVTALRFLEWVCLNLGGVVALPTGRTPEFFIKWMQFYLANWDREIKTLCFAGLMVSSI